jgi:hypothetical protein
MGNAPEERHKMADCPKCRGAMTEGFVILPDTGGRVKWVDGERSLWASLMGGLGRKLAELSSLRCTKCGFVELFVETQSQPVKTLKVINDENERLRSLVIKLQDRVATLETIATDPGERTAREIAALRDLPSSKGASD